MVESIVIASGLDESRNMESKMVPRFLSPANKFTVVPIPGDINYCGRMEFGRQQASALRHPKISNLLEATELESDRV